MSDPLGTPGSPKSLPLILARELASNLATPMFLLDVGGMLVFYNDAAAMLLGQAVRRAGRDPLGRVRRGTAAGDPRRRTDPAARLAAGIAFFERRPAHETLLATAYNGVRRLYEATAYPLFGASGGDARRRRRVLGRLARGHRRSLMRVRVWGCRGSVAAPGADTVQLRREHVVRRGTPVERARARPRRRDGHAARWAWRCSRTCRWSCTSCSRTCISTTCRVSGSSVPCSRPASTSTSGARRRRCSTCRSGSRCTSRRRCSPFASRTCRRASPSTTRPKSP